MDSRRIATKEEFLEQYASGVRNFAGFVLENLWFEEDLVDVDFSDANLSGSTFIAMTLNRVRFDRSNLMDVTFQEISFLDCSLHEADLAFTVIGDCELNESDFAGADLFITLIRRTDSGRGSFSDAKLEGVIFVNSDIRALCRANTTLVHNGPSSVDHTTVIRSMLAPNLHDFLLRMGMPPIFVDYTIECARAIENPVLSRMMQSTFISFGGPDTAFARKLYEALHGNGVRVFFFPEHATPGKRLHRVMREGVNQHDRVVLVCSEASLNRSGVLNEIEETLAREAREGGETYLIPITLDDYVFSGWAPTRPDLAQAIRDRVVADFTGADTDENRFNAALLRLLAALKR